MHIGDNLFLTVRSNITKLHFGCFKALKIARMRVDHEHDDMHVEGNSVTSDLN